ncbi:MAG: thymidine phosphorylase [Candidatus Poseidoniales archaeon]
MPKLWTIPEIIAHKRDGNEMDQGLISTVVSRIVDGSMSPVQIGAWLMACQINGLSPDETAYLTEKMAFSGEHFVAEPDRVDKHSTGGVGDKMSLILAPLLRAAGLRVPMLAGRGLAHTGGTIDKLESIPGFNTGLTLEEMATNPCFISRQSKQIAPADRILYAARDVTATVPCIGLITASIISKKVAEGLDRLVLDVKCGKAAFMKNIDDARTLAKSMVEVGTILEVGIVAQITEMDTPIGEMLGNSHEIVEVIQCLKGQGPRDTMELVRIQAEALGVDISPHLKDGSGLEQFKQMCIRQGVEVDVVEKLCTDPWSVLPKAKQRFTWNARSSGWITDIDAYRLGTLLLSMGAGRNHPDDKINHGAGIELLFTVGDYVKAGEPIVHLDMEDWDNDHPGIGDAYTFSENPPSQPRPSRLIETIFADK